LDGHPRTAQGATFEDAGEDLGPIGLLAGGREHALPGPASIQVALDLRDVDFEAGRAALDHHADPTTVGFAEGRDAKEASKDATHARADSPAPDGGRFER
jgi:hypothetical protein